MGSPGNNNLRDHIFGMSHQPNEVFNKPERPNHTIEVTLRLQKSVSIILNNLVMDLNRDCMRARADVPNNNITVTGIPPDVGYDAQSVLQVVRNHDSLATIISHKVLQ